LKAGNQCSETGKTKEGEVTAYSYTSNIY
jgi:hypothetical protein